MKQPRQPDPTRGGTDATRGIGTHRVGLRIGVASSSISVMQKVRDADASIAVKSCRSGWGAKQPPAFIDLT